MQARFIAALVLCVIVMTESTGSVEREFRCQLSFSVHRHYSTQPSTLRSTLHRGVLGAAVFPSIQWLKSRT